MNKIINKLFILNLLVIFFCLVLLKILLSWPELSLLKIIVASLVLSLALKLTAGRFFFSPFQQIFDVMKRMAQGDFTGRLGFYHQDEFRKLAEHISEISQQLQHKIKAIQEDENELKAILAHMVEGVILINKNEKIVVMNNPVYAMLNLRSKDAIGKPYWEVIRHDEINAILKEAFSEKKSLSKELTLISPQENHFLMQVSAVLTDEKNLSSVVAVFHDITEIKKLAKVRSEFVANVSHELKTPLTAIKGFVETLQEGAFEDKETSQKFLNIIQEHTQRLETLVNDLLNLSALESKETKLIIEQTPLKTLVESAMGLLKKKLEDKKHRLLLKIPPALPPLLVDRSKMQQVFLNLLDNAIKFTPSGGTITVSAFQNHNSIRIDVQDTGIGIEQHHIPRLFERFYRVDKGRSRELGGTGLGLAIVKHIVQSHQGKISVQSTPGQGSTFTISLPL